MHDNQRGGGTSGHPWLFSKIVRWLTGATTGRPEMFGGFPARPCHLMSRLDGPFGPARLDARPRPSMLKDRLPFDKNPSNPPAPAPRVYGTPVWVKPGRRPHMRRRAGRRTLPLKDDHGVKPEPPDDDGCASITPLSLGSCTCGTPSGRAVYGDTGRCDDDIGGPPIGCSPPPPAKGM
jgi:hypothetical protein